MRIIKEKAPHAVVRVEKPNEVKISLNAADSQGFSAMFANLEEKSAFLGIENIDVTMSTMENAYIK